MSPNESPQSERPKYKLLNKNFYRFFFSFIAVIASVLLLILGIGAGSGI